MNKKRISTNKFISSMCRQSYHQFFLEFWPVTAAEKLVDSWYIKRLCDELQVLSERVFLDEPKTHDLAWNCPPGTSKSSVVSILWQPWIWTRMPSARFISGSYSERLALDHSRKSRDVVLSDKYKTLFPDVQLREDQNTKGYFANTRGGIRYAVGVGGTVIGMHAHFISIDDPLDPQAALSDLKLAESNLWIEETLSRRKVNAMLTPMVLIMQRLHQDDPTNRMLTRGTNLKHFCVPCDNSWEIKPESLKEWYEDGLLDPKRLPRPALEDAYKTLGEAGYASQMGQSPVPRGGAMFKVDRLNYSTVLPRKWKRGPIRYWDKAATAGSGCFTVGAKIGVDENDLVWILDMCRGQWDSGTRENKILTISKLDTKYTKQWVEQEPGASGKSDAESTVKRLTLAGFRASMDKASGDKELRADPLSEQVNMGNVVVVTAPWNKELVEEMRFFPRSKYKDQIDALSGGFNKLAQPKYRIGTL